MVRRFKTGRTRELFEPAADEAAVDEDLLSDEERAERANQKEK